MSRIEAVSFRSVLVNRGFLRLWSAQVVSQVGDWLAVVAIFSRVAFAAGGTPSEVSGILVAFLLPFALLGPLPGVLVDRWHPRSAMVASDLARAVLVVLLAFATSLAWTYVLVFLLSVVSAFFLPAQTVAVPLLVRREQLLVANSINTQTLHLTKVIGPALGGLLVGAVGETACFLIDAGSFVASAVVLSGLRLRRQEAGAQGTAPSVLRDLVEGVRFASRRASLVFVMVTMGATVLTLGAFNSLLAVYVRELLAGGARAFGLLVSALGAGTIAGALLVGKCAQRVPRAPLAALGILALGAGLFGFTAAAHLAVVLGWSTLLGLFAGAVFVPTQTLVQEDTPSGLLGRVSSTLASTATLSQLAGIAGAGLVAEALGLRAVFRLVAAGLVAIGLSAFFYARARGIGRLPPASPHPSTVRATARS
ncbi:MAG: MFS transporter [Thermoanaerobaculia bacterium]